MKRATSVIGLVAGAVLIAACSGSSDSDAATTTRATTVTTAATTTAPPDTGGDVSVENFAFGPANTTVSVGDTVTWTNNEDSVGHTTTSDDGFWKSDLLKPGDGFERTFDEAGTFTYFCSIHPSMKASITVEG
jgi:plastocyanin